jgi:hypothetical protein
MKPIKFLWRWKERLTKNYSRNSKEKELEGGAEQVLLVVMKRRMNPLVSKVIEEEMTLEDENISALLLAIYME